MKPDEEISSTVDETARGIEQRSVMGVVLLTAGMIAAAASLLWSVGGASQALLARPWWAAVVVALLYALAERFPFHIEYRREAMSFSLSEVPTVLALAFLGPVVAICARFIGSTVSIVASSRQPVYKRVFNTALFAVEISLAYVIVRQFVGVDDFDGTTFLFAAAGATTVATMVGSVVVAMAISLFEGDMANRVAQTLRTFAFIGPLTGTVAAVAVAPALFGFGTAVVSIVPVVSVWVVLLRLGRVGQSHRDLQAMHGFARVVGQTLDSQVVATIAVNEAVRLIRAGSAMVVVFDHDGDIVACATIGDDLPVAPTNRSDDRWTSVFDSDRASFVDAVLDWRTPAAGTDRSNAIVAPIRSDEQVLGLLVLADRQGVQDLFDAHDLERTTTLSEHLSISLGKTLLHRSIEHAATHDSLTGHFNRSAFDLAVTAAVAAPRAGVCTAVLMLDLDRFKEINDTLGHHVGDEVLVEFAARMDRLLSAEDILARFGGDEFAVLVERPTLAEVRDVADQILTESYVPLKLDDLDVVVAVSVGIAAVTADDCDSTAVLRRADIAMYTAKRQHAGFEVYSEEIDRRTPERLSLLGDLRGALEDQAITVQYQPKIDLVTSTVVGFEALARWQHPTRGSVPPDEFIPIAEESGLIKQLTDQVLTAAIKKASSWRDAGLDLRIAVNLSTLDLLDELLADRVAHRLEKFGLASHHLTLEITESALMVDTPRTMATIELLRRSGVILSLDDFGTGYSSLSYLRQLPVTELKIDRSFVANIILDPQDEMIVRSTIDLGHNLGLNVVAEGIENQPVLERLLALGCDTGQGYGISRPLTPEHVDAWLRTCEYNIAPVIPAELSNQERPSQTSSR